MTIIILSNHHCESLNGYEPVCCIPTLQLWSDPPPLLTAPAWLPVPHPEVPALCLVPRHTSCPRGVLQDCCSAHAARLLPHFPQAPLASVSHLMPLC